MEEDRGMKKLCSPSHISKIAYYCTQEEIYICEECAETYHYQHLEKLQGILSMTQDKLSKYTNMKEKAQLVRKMSMTLEDLHTQISVQLADIYDKFIQDVIAHKQGFIDKWVKSLLPGDAVDNFKEMKISLSHTIDEIEQAHTKINEYCKEKGDVEDILYIQEPDSLGEKMDYLTTQNAMMRGFKKLKIDYKFDYRHIDNMFDIEQQEEFGENRELDGMYVPQLTNSKGIIRIFDIANHSIKHVSISKGGFPRYSATCSINNLIYAAGNYSKDEKAGYLYEINGNTGVFKQLASMIDRRCSFCLVSTSPSELYAIGGTPQKYGVYGLDKCEKYNVKENKWASVGALNIGRSYHGACYFPTTKEIYVYGGNGAPDGSATASIEKLSILEGRKWVEILNFIGQGDWVPTCNIQCRTISPSKIMIFGDANFIYDVGKMHIYPTHKPPHTKELGNYYVSSVTNKDKIYCFNDKNQNELLEYSIKGAKWNSMHFK